MPAPAERQVPKIPTIAESLFYLVDFVEQHKAALIGVECTSEEYEESVQPAFTALREAGLVPARKL